MQAWIDPSPWGQVEEALGPDLGTQDWHRALDPSPGTWGQTEATKGPRSPSYRAESSPAWRLASCHSLHSCGQKVDCCGRCFLLSLCELPCCKKYFTVLKAYLLSIRSLFCTGCKCHGNKFDLIKEVFACAFSCFL